jgi:hypothetical protein
MFWGQHTKRTIEYVKLRNSLLNRREIKSTGFRIGRKRRNPFIGVPDVVSGQIDVLPATGDRCDKSESSIDQPSSRRDPMARAIPPRVNGSSSYRPPTSGSGCTLTRSRSRREACYRASRRSLGRQNPETLILSANIQRPRDKARWQSRRLWL